MPGSLLKLLLTKTLIMDNPDCIASLVEALNNADLKQFPSILKNMNIDTSVFEDHATWDTQDYTRNCIERNDRYELLLLCWNPGNVTPIHSHGGQKCWVYQIAGELSEQRFINTENGPTETHRQVLKPHNLTYMDDRMGFHVLQNNSKERSMSLHVYAHPIVKCKVFNDQTKDFEVKKLKYDQVVEHIA